MAAARHYIHLTLEMRKEIENGAVEGRSLARMAEGLDVDATSIPRELRRNRCAQPKNPNRSLRNDCAHGTTCKRRRVCDPDCKRKCPSCARMCRGAGCAGCERQWCGSTHRAPWVCNGCGRRPTCPLGHFTHSAKVAQAKADERLVESRRGLDMTGREMAFLAQEVKAGLAKGQSVHHVFALRDDLPCSERSSCRHVENEGIDVAEMGLRKKARYKRRYRRKANRHEKEFYRGREHADYLALPEVQRMRTVEMDCVEGAEGDSQALLTPRFVQIRSQIYILLKGHGCAHVVAAPDWLEGPLGGPEAFRRAFGLILTDRGSEFGDVAGIERNGRCHVFYADPQRSGQKGACEKNHVELRKVISKGTSIDALALDAWILAGICPNVDSSLRLAVGDASPMALARAALPASLLEGLGLAPVPPDEVEMRPELVERLRKEHDSTNG